MAFSLMTATVKLTALPLLRITIPYWILSTPPPIPLMYIPACLCLLACIRRHFLWQSSVGVFIPSKLVMSASTRVRVLYTLHFCPPVVDHWSWS